MPAGSSVRFEPGDSKTVTLVGIRATQCALSHRAPSTRRTAVLVHHGVAQVDIGGSRRVLSGNRLVDGEASPDRLDEVSLPRSPTISRDLA